MTYEFKLPDIGEGVVEGEVVRWLVKDGDPLREDQPMVEIMTDKATVEIPAPRAGRVAQAHVRRGPALPGRQGADHHRRSTARRQRRRRRRRRQRQPATAEPSAVSAAGTACTRPRRSARRTRAGKSNGTADARACWRRRRRASSRATSASTSATSPGPARAGRVTSDDVREHQASAGGATRAARAARRDRRCVALHTPARETADVRVPFRGVRKKIAENMVRSKHTAAHFTYVEEVDCTDLVALRQRANERLGERGVKLSFLPFIIKATVAALQKFPQLNATLDEAAGEIVQRQQLPHRPRDRDRRPGLIVPVVRDADRRSLVDLAQEIDAPGRGDAHRARRRATSWSARRSPSRRPGALGGVLATPIINFPEVAILGVHKIAKRPAVAATGSEIVIRDLMNLSISVDHRVVEGYDAARFVAEIKAALETPGLMFLESV